MPRTRPAELTALSPGRWRVHARSHAERALDLTGAARARRTRGEKHPVEDFLYEYYTVRPGALDRWEPGLGTGLATAAVAGEPDADLSREVLSRRWYRRDEAGVIALDVSAYRQDRGRDVAMMDQILRATAGREASFGCLGLHEWAMVYRQQRPRHPLPLRLGPAGTSAVVEAATLRCTHVDAFRFFTAAARPLNRHQLSRESQAQFEQPGCLHANMDLFRWAWKLGPAVPGSLLLDCFALAKDVRVLDMEASPYDCRSLGYGVVPIETAEGRASYIARQREFAQRAQPLRASLLLVTGELLGGQSRAAEPPQR